VGAGRRLGESRRLRSAEASPAPAAVYGPWPRAGRRRRARYMDRPRRDRNRTTESTRRGRLARAYRPADQL